MILASLASCTSKSPELLIAEGVKLPAAFILCVDGEPKGCFEYKNVDFSVFKANQADSLRNIIVNQQLCESKRRSLIDYIKSQNAK